MPLQPRHPEGSAQRRAHATRQGQAHGQHHRTPRAPARKTARIPTSSLAGTPVGRALISCKVARFSSGRAGPKPSGW